MVGEHAPAAAIAVPFIKASNARRALALRRRALLSAPAADHRRRDRHQRQDLGRGLHPANLDAAKVSQAASIGTIGLVSPKRTVYGSLTTPDPISLHKTLDEIAGEGVTHLAFEASSHGLDQHRLDGVRVDAGAFTNLSRDHMDYHPTVEHYLGAKLRLFTDLVKAGRRGRDRRRSRAFGRGRRRGAQARPARDHRRPQGRAASAWSTPRSTALVRS